MNSVKLAGAALAFLTVTACDSNRVPVDGTIYSATYKCRYEIKGQEARDMADRARAGETPSEEETFGDCSRDPDFLRARADFDNFKTRLSGHATFRVSYVSPIDNSSQEGEIEFDGDDREFYTLRTNTPVKLLVNRGDHSDILYGH